VPAAERASIALVRLGHVVVVEAVDDRVGVDARESAQRAPDQLVVVEQQRRREVSELERAQDSPFASRRVQARRDDGAAAAAGAGEALLGREPEGHPVPVPEPHVPEHRSRRRVSALDEAARVLAKADHHESPLELAAVAPLEHAERRVRRVGPRTGSVGVEGRPDHGRMTIVVAANGGLRARCYPAAARPR
jgi:hypothetical protein